MLYDAVFRKVGEEMLNLTWWFIAPLLAIAAVLIWWGLPQWQIRRFRKKFATEIANGTIKDIEIETLGDDYRKTVTQGLGGVTLIIGAFVAYLQWHDTRQSVTDTNLNSLFSKGFDLLGTASSIPQQVGGINALRSWARSNPKIYPSVLTALISLVRQKAALESEDEPLVSKKCVDYKANKLNPRIRPVLQMALDVLKDNPTGEPIELDLSRLNLKGADLRGLDLTKTHFEYSDLSDSHLEKANLTDVDLYCTNFYDAHLEGANLSAHDVGQGHSAADAIFTVAHLENASFRGRDLKGALLSEATLIGTDLTDADMTKVDFYCATLKNTTVSHETSIQDACIEGAKLKEAHLENAMGWPPRQLCGISPNPCHGR